MLGEAKIGPGEALFSEASGSGVVEDAVFGATILVGIILCGCFLSDGGKENDALHMAAVFKGDAHATRIADF